VNSAACDSRDPDKTLQETLADMENGKEITLARDIKGRYTSVEDVNTYIIWRDGSRIFYVSSVSDSGKGHEMALEVANAIILAQ